MKSGLARTDSSYRWVSPRGTERVGTHEIIVVVVVVVVVVVAVVAFRALYAGGNQVDGLPPAFSFFGFFLSIRLIKSQNGFETKAVTCTSGWCHGTRNDSQIVSAEE